MYRFSAVVIVTLFAQSVLAIAASADEPRITVDRRADRLRISIGGAVFADYVFRDDKTLRPYFTNVKAKGGVRVTRHHPPRPGKDSVDHATMHPGIWLAFGDISGADFWRNKARVEHVEFLKQPAVQNRRLTFTVRNRYRKGGRTVCVEDCTHTISAHRTGYLLTYDSRFHGEKALTFGDQEEMGLGVRVAAPLRVRGGNGRILNADGKVDEKAVRGTNAMWCDYSGTREGKRCGIVLMPHPGNFRKSWYHARNYGFVCANPFGRRALTGGAKSRVVVEPGSTLRLRFGVFIYARADSRPLPVKQINKLHRIYRDEQK